ncbi:MAG: substrate-binding domain-containing protein [Acidimicrobiia bacterium]|nr:substrate-binding domain-containing protein [Acidimicrobiia bacterium]
MLGLLIGLVLVAAACGSSDSDSDSPSSAEDDAAAGDVSGAINVSGSSTVEPVTARAAELFNDNVSNDVEITVDGPGTGDGFQLFCLGETDISDASRAIKEAEAADCEANGISYVELLVAFDGIAVMTHPDNAITCVNYGDLYALLGPEADGFGNWAEAQAIADELGTTNTFPDASLDITAPGTESGTYDSFIEIVLEGIGEQRLGEDADTFIRTDIAGQAEDNVIIQGVSGSGSSLGWVGFAFAAENADAVKVLEVDDGQSGCIAPTIDTIADGSYPVSRPLYIYVNTERAATDDGLVQFVDYYFGDAYIDSVTRAFGDTGYVALPDDLLAATQAAWEGR